MKPTFFRTLLLPLLAAAALPLAWAPARAQETAWRPAAAPLMTAWGREVTPETARREYPRPLFQRKEWLSLNGLWEFAFDERNEGRAGGWASGKSLPLRILVPFTYEAALSGIGKGTEVHERVWYRRTFTVPDGWRGRRVMLNFNACDWETTAWLNGKELGTHRGGYDPFSFDLTDALKPGGEQELVVAVHDPADPRRGAFQPKGKQLGSEGIWYTRTTGIWQSVWLEPLHPAALEIADMRTEVDLATRQGQVTAAVWMRDPAATDVELVVLRRGKEVGRQAYSVQAPRPAARVAYLAPIVRDCELWSPEKPVLYDLVFRVRQNGRVVDEIRSYTAFRRYEVKDGRLALNGQPYFLRGVLDQGYWPDGILTPPSDAAMRADVEMTKRLGFNMSRKHVKVEDPRWYYWCDRLGVAVWQDMPSSHNLATPAAKENFRQEWRAAMKTTAGYPSVLHWIPFNENWGDPGPFQDEIVRLTRQLDPTRPITDASGWTQRDETDVIDLHDYTNNLVRHAVRNPVKPKVIGEYGGIALPIPGHTWTTGWGYQNARDADGLVRRVRMQTTQLFEAENLSGFVYTQLTDVEQELNGLLTYDRLPKAAPERFAAVFTGKDRAAAPTGFLRDWLVLGPIPTGTDLRTPEDHAANRAAMKALLDRAYLPDEATVDPREGAQVTVGGKSYTWRRVRLDGDALDFHALFGGETRNAVAFAVAEVPAERAVRNATLLLGSDDGARVWLNGRPVHSADRIRGVNVDEDEVPGVSLRPGRNLLVVKVGQGMGGWGLAARFEGLPAAPRR